MAVWIFWSHGPLEFSSVNRIGMSIEWASALVPPTPPIWGLLYMALKGGAWVRRCAPGAPRAWGSRGIRRRSGPRLQEGVVEAAARDSEHFKGFFKGFKGFKRLKAGKRQA